MKVVIHSTYEYLRDWIERIPDSFGDGGEIIQENRNVIKVFSLDIGITVNVKRFKKPHLINRIVYTFFRKSKASRSYYNTLRIAEKGFETADPIAYIEIKKNGLLSDSFYISLQCNPVKQMREYYWGPLSGNEKLIDAFARYSAALHDAGIYHLDYSSGNILIRDDAGKYTFILVDVNRMKFMPVNIDKGCRNFARLFDNDEIYRRIAETYSQSRIPVFDKEEAIRLIMKYKNQFLQKNVRKEKMRKWLKK